MALPLTREYLIALQGHKPVVLFFCFVCQKMFDIALVGRLAFHVTTQAVTGFALGGGLEFLFAGLPGSQMQVDCLGNALVAGIEVMAQLTLSCLGATMVYKQLMGLPVYAEDPAQGVAFLMALLYSQPELGDRAVRLITFVKTALGLADVPTTESPHSAAGSVGHTKRTMKNHTASKSPRGMGVDT